MKPHEMSIGVEELAVVLHMAQSKLLVSKGSAKIEWKDVPESRREAYRARAGYILAEYNVFYIDRDLVE